MANVEALCCCKSLVSIVACEYGELWTGIIFHCRKTGFFWFSGVIDRFWLLFFLICIFNCISYCWRAVLRIRFFRQLSILFMETMTNSRCFFSFLSQRNFYVQVYPCMIEELFIFLDRETRASVMCFFHNDRVVDCELCWALSV